MARDIFETSDTFELGDVIKSNIEYYLRHSFNTGMPAQVTNVDSYQEKQVVSVIPIINTVFKDRTVMEYPELHDVPTILPGAGRGLLSFPVKVNDVVWLQFSQRALERFRGAAGTEEEGLPFNRLTPDDRSFNHLKDCVAIIGLNSETSHCRPNPDDVELKFAGSYVRMQPDGTVLVKAAKDLIATVQGDTSLTGAGKLDLDITSDVNIKSGSKIVLEAPAVEVVGPLSGDSTASFDGDLDANEVTATTGAGTTLSTHSHPITSGSSAPGPTGPPTPGS